MKDIKARNKARIKGQIKGQFVIQKMIQTNHKWEKGDLMGDHLLDL